MIHWPSYIEARFRKGFQLAFVGKYIFTEISNLPIHSFLAPISSVRFIWLWKLWFALRYSAKKIIASQNPFNRRERYGVWKMRCWLHFWSSINGFLLLSITTFLCSLQLNIFLRPDLGLFSTENRWICFFIMFWAAHKEIFNFRAINLCGWPSLCNDQSLVNDQFAFVYWNHSHIRKYWF